jgi:hypothetical protein
MLEPWVGGSAGGGRVALHGRTDGWLLHTCVCVVWGPGELAGRRVVRSMVLAPQRPSGAAQLALPSSPRPPCHPAPAVNAMQCQCSINIITAISMQYQCNMPAALPCRPSAALPRAGTYVIPPPGPHGSYLEAIAGLPLFPQPEAFGLHANADITKDLQQTGLLLDTLLTAGGGGGGKGGGAGGGGDEVVAAMVQVRAFGAGHEGAGL